MGRYLPPGTLPRAGTAVYRRALLRGSPRGREGLAPRALRGRTHLESEHLSSGFSLLLSGARTRANDAAGSSGAHVDAQEGRRERARGFFFFFFLVLLAGLRGISHDEDNMM